MTGFIRSCLHKIASLANAVLTRLDAVVGVTPALQLIPIRVEDRSKQRGRR
ncbi:MAG TPA: hypothetical protein VGC40_12325 [Paenirhodobacter sp.]